MKYYCPAEARTKTGNLRYLDKLKPIARVNRNQMTEAEKIVWFNILKNRQTGYLFFRQKPISQFVADFYCSKLLLIIEIDGEIHEQQRYRDKERDKYFEIRKIKTIRIKNAEVLSDLPKVKRKITLETKNRQSELGKK